ncbi:MAG: tripartite tricarboxylate transporter substrate binding protein [Hyphomicrobiaceae bacterium]|nr:tripartite tricarboxylate transporter substrate binding protein [Hyphomicrobiaceae bacterium]
MRMTPVRPLAALASLVGLWLGLLVAQSAAQAQSYPSRTITLVVPFQAGSGTDTVGRILAEHMGKALGQSIVIENKAGANGTIAANFVARAAPDGHTLFLSTNTPHAAAATLMRSISYDPIKDFAPISKVGMYTFVLAVHPGIPAKSMKELIALAKAKPGELSYASGNSTGIVSGERLKTLAGIDVLHVPYKSSPGALNDVLAGRVSMMFIDLAPGLPHIEAGALRALAATTKARSPLLPQIPSMLEAGVPDFVIDSWAAMFAPANTPKEIVARLNETVRAVLAKPEVTQLLAKGGFAASSSTPEELGTYAKEQLALWTQMIKDAGIARSEGSQ